jgi:transmembrane sensor
MSKETSKQIEQRAMAWLSQRDSGRWSEADQNDFAQWMRADVLHRVTLLRCEALWERTERLKAFGAGKTPGLVPPPGEWRSSPFFERRPASHARGIVGTFKQRMAAAIAAALLLTVGAGVYVKSLTRGEAYATPIGAVTSIPLSDGSSVLLNSGGKLRVALTDKERLIKLETGEAFFDVAKDPERPFVVQAGQKRIVAVGTRFSVRRQDSEVQVIVTDGKVRVQPSSKAGSGKLLTAGAMIRTERDALVVERKTPHEAEEALSWRSGHLIFKETPLADAVAEFNRYTRQQIVIDDPELAALRISGKFRSTYAGSFVELLEKGFGIGVRQADETIHLTAN